MCSGFARNCPCSEHNNGNPLLRKQKTTFLNSERTTETVSRCKTVGCSECNEFSKHWTEHAAASIVDRGRELERRWWLAGGKSKKKYIAISRVTTSARDGIIRYVRGSIYVKQKKDGPSNVFFVYSRLARGHVVVAINIITADVPR